MSFWTWFVIYVKALRPSALAATLRRREGAAYQRGFENGFDKGHRRGWLDLRAKVSKSPNKYPHEPATDRS